MEEALRPLIPIIAIIILQKRNPIDILAHLPALKREPLHPTDPRTNPLHHTNLHINQVLLINPAQVTNLPINHQPDRNHRISLHINLPVQAVNLRISHHIRESPVVEVPGVHPPGAVHPVLHQAHTKKRNDILNNKCKRNVKRINPAIQRSSGSQGVGYTNSLFFCKQNKMIPDVDYLKLFQITQTFQFFLGFIPFFIEVNIFI